MAEAKIDLEMLRAQTEAGYVPVSEYVQAKEKADTEAMLARLRQIKAESCEKATKGDVSQPEYVLVPKEPTPEMLGAFYRVKNGHHFHDEPPPTDRSDYAAYRAMIAAAPPTPSGVMP